MCVCLLSRRRHSSLGYSWYRRGWTSATVPREDQRQLYTSGREQINPPRLLIEFPDVLAEKGLPGLVNNHIPIIVGPRPEATPVRRKQYPVPREARLGIRDHSQRLRDAEIVIKCQSPWNTPLLPVKKSGGNDYRPIQNLRAMNSAVIIIHPMVPNPYTLLSLLLAQTCSSPASISRMHSSASDCHQPASPCLTLNEMTHTPGKRHS